MFWTISTFEKQSTISKKKKKKLRKVLLPLPFKISLVHKNFPLEIFIYLSLLPRYSNSLLTAIRSKKKKNSPFSIKIYTAESVGSWKFLEVEKIINTYWMNYYWSILNHLPNTDSSFFKYFCLSHSALNTFQKNWT